MSQRSIHYLPMSCWRGRWTVLCSIVLAANGSAVQCEPGGKARKSLVLRSVELALC